MSNERTTYVEERLASLRSLKEEHNLQTKAEQWKKKANIKEVNTPSENDFRTQVWVTVKMQKDAQLLSAQPEWSFIPLSEKGRKHRKLAKYAWNYHWLIANTDSVISEAIQQSTTYWTWVVFEWIKHIWKKQKTPSYIYNEDWKVIDIEYKEEEILDYSWIWSEVIPFQNFFINWTSFNDATEAIVVRYFDKDWYISEKTADLSFDQSAVKKIKTWTSMTSAVDWTVWNSIDSTSTENTVVEIEYWNVARDEYIIQANWEVIKDSPIPYTHKKLPFSLYIDNKWDGKIWGIWEFELLEQEERFKNELRTLLVRGIKSSIWVILKNSDSEIEEDEIEYGIWEVYNTADVNWLKQFAPTVPIWAISQAEDKVDNDIIAKTWVDHKSQQLSSSETATKTEGKAKSWQKRINKNIKDNAYNFYRRLAELRMANIQFIHSTWNMEIPIEGGSIDSKWVFTSDEGWYGSAILTGEMLEGSITVMPIVETMLWDSKERAKQNSLSAVQILQKLQDKDGSKPVSALQLARLIADAFDMDFERLTEQTQTAKDPKTILEQAKLQRQWTKWTSADPNFVPPAQRNGQWWWGWGAMLSWQANLPSAE